MADLAAQREARKRKITQNAEARMNRLLGGVGDHKSSPEPESKDEALNSTEIPSDGSLEPKSSPECGDTVQTTVKSETTSSPYNLRHRTTKISPSVSPDAETEITTNNNSTSEQEHLRDSTSDRAVTYEQENLSQRPKLRRDVRAPLVTDKAPPVFTSSTTKAAITDAQTYQLVHISACVIAAFLAQFALNKVGVGLFYFQTILLPFIAMQILLSYLKRTHLKHLGLQAAPSSLWSTALVLCGVRQELIAHYNVIMAHITAATSDFCLYLFAFILFNAVFG